jgi:hypothetical protein
MREIPRVWLALVLTVACGLVFWPGLGGGFLFDDFNNILTNPKIQITSLDGKSLLRAAGAYDAGTYGRPLATLSFALDFYLGGKDPWGYKLSNLIVHAANSLLVLLLVGRLLTLAQVTGNTKSWMSLSVALAWAIHPLQVSTVMYVVQRMEMLSATFVLLALLAYLRGRSRQLVGERGWPWLLASVLLTGVGMLAKESAILAPGFALVAELTLLHFRAGSTRTVRLLKWGFTAGVAVALLVYFAYVLPRYLGPDAYAGRTFTLAERLLTQLRVLPMHLGQILLPAPTNMSFYYDDYPKSTGLLTPWTTLAGGVLLAALAVFAWLKRRTMPLVSLGILWFFVAHSMTSNVINLEMVFEHRNYLALLGVVIAVADLVRRMPMQDGPQLKVFGVAVVLVALGGLTALRSATWGNELLLASYLVAKNPTSPRAGHDMGTVYANMSGGNADSPFYQFSIREFERTSRLPGASPLLEQGLIILSATAGQPAEAVWWDQLIRKIREQPLGPEQVMAVSGLMTQYERGIPIDAHRLAEAYEAMLARGPWPGFIYAQFGDFMLVAFNDQDRAEQLFVMAVKADPSDLVFNARVLSTLMSDGHTRQADAVLRELEGGAPRSAAGRQD